VPVPANGAQLLNNVIFGNGVDASKSQFTSVTGCLFHNTVVGPSESATAQGLVKGDFDLNDFSDDLRTVAGTGSDKSVIDQAKPYTNPSGITEAIPAYDLDGNPRPQPTGGAADVGATEVKK
jgi:hypothetical protein